MEEEEFAGVWTHPSFKQHQDNLAYQLSSTDLKNSLQLTLLTLAVLYLLSAFPIFPENISYPISVLFLALLAISYVGILRKVLWGSKTQSTFENQTSAYLSPTQKKLMGLQSTPYKKSPLSSTTNRKSPASAIKTPKYDRTPSKRSNLSKTPHTSPHISAFTPSKTPTSHASPLTTYLQSSSSVKASSPHTHEPYIRDKQDLERLVNSPLSKENVYAQHHSFQQMDFSNIPKYKSASKREADKSTPKVRMKDNDKIMDVLDYDVVLKVEPNINVNEAVLDNWTENMRKWLSTKVLHPLISRIDAIEKTFEAEGISYLDCRNATLQSTSTTPSDPTKPKTLIELAQRLGTNPLIQERMDLESFIAFPDSRAYVVDRIKELGKGGCLSGYHWNSGGHFGGKPWNKDFPTDSQLMMTLFCHFMDTQLHGEKLYGSRPFTNKYYAPSSSSFNSHAPVIIRSTESHLYNLVIDNKVIWGDVSKGNSRNNLFLTLAFFVLKIKLTEQGYLGCLNLNSIDLGQQVGF